MKTTNLLYVLSLFSLLIFSARGMENKKKSCYLSGKIYTNKVLDYFKCIVDEKGMLINQASKTELSNNIEILIQKEIAKITNINSQLQNPTIEKILANQKKETLSHHKFRRTN